MKILSNIIDKQKIEAYCKGVIDILIVGNQEYSSRHQVDFSLEEIKAWKQRLPKEKKLFVLMNQLYDQSKLEMLEKTLLALDSCRIDGIIFQDFAILQIIKELQLSFTLFYDSLTLNTNAATLSYLSSLGIDAFFLSREISVEDIEEIAKEMSQQSVVQIDGLRYIAQSKRPLLSNYFNALEMDRDPRTIYSIQPANSTIVDYIFEDDYGCHIVSKDRLLSYDIFERLLDSHIEYGYINGLFMSYQQQNEIVESYQQLIKLYQTEEYQRYLSSLSNQDGDYGFYYDTTVYKLEDVRKRDANERDK